MRIRKVLYDHWLQIFGVILLGVLFAVIYVFVLAQFFAEKSYMSIDCQGIQTLTNFSNLPPFKVVVLRFINNANFAGEDFNAILVGIPKNYLSNYGLPNTYSTLCKPVENNFTGFAQFKCDYIPAKSSVELRLLPDYNSFKISYWSKTTPKKTIDVNCSNL